MQKEEQENNHIIIPSGKNVFSCLFLSVARYFGYTFTMRNSLNNKQRAFPYLWSKQVSGYKKMVKQ